MIICSREQERIDWTCPHKECGRTIAKKHWESILGFNRRVIKHLRKHLRSNNTEISQSDHNLRGDNYGI
jgi:hypothetical protein